MSSESCLTRFIHRLDFLPDFIKSYFINADSYCITINDKKTQEMQIKLFLSHMISIGKYKEMLAESRGEKYLEDIYKTHYEGSISLLYDYISTRKEVSKRVEQALEDKYVKQEKDGKVLAPPGLVSSVDSVTINSVIYNYNRFKIPLEEDEKTGEYKKEFTKDKYIARIVQNIPGYKEEKFLGSLKRKIAKLFTEDESIDVIPTTLGINHIELIRKDKPVKKEKLGKRKLEEIKDKSDSDKKEDDYYEYKDIGGHQNLLIFRRSGKDKNTIDVYRFEPHGFETLIDIRSQSSEGKNTEDQLHDFLKQNLESNDVIEGGKIIKFNYIPPKDWIPCTHCQGAEEDTTEKRGRESGFCQIWCSLFLYLMIVYDKLDINEILDLLNESYGWGKDKINLKFCDEKTSFAAYHLVTGFAFFILEKMQKDENLNFLETLHEDNKKRLEKMTKMRRELSDLIKSEKIEVTKSKLKRRPATLRIDEELDEELDEEKDEGKIYKNAIIDNTIEFLKLKSNLYKYDCIDKTCKQEEKERVKAVVKKGGKGKDKKK